MSAERIMSGEQTMHYRFYGQDVLISTREQDEPLVGKTGFTERQLGDIRNLAKQKRRFDLARIRRCGLM